MTPGTGELPRSPESQWVASLAVHDALIIGLLANEALVSHGYSRDDQDAFYESLDWLVSRSLHGRDVRDARSLFALKQALDGSEIHERIAERFVGSEWRLQLRWEAVLLTAHELLTRRGLDVRAVRAVMVAALKGFTTVAPAGDYRENSGRWTEYARYALTIARECAAPSSREQVEIACVNVIEKSFGPGWNGDPGPIVAAILAVRPPQVGNDRALSSATAVLRSADRLSVLSLRALKAPPVAVDPERCYFLVHLAAAGCSVTRRWTATRDELLSWAAALEGGKDGALPDIGEGMTLSVKGESVTISVASSSHPDATATVVFIPEAEGLKRLAASIRLAIKKAVPADAGFQQAFPATLAGDVATVLSLMPAARIGPSSGGERYQVGAEELWMPNRMYFGRPTRAESLTDTQRSVLAAIYTRHNDGKIRQVYLRSLLDNDSDWVVPFIIRLLGEYVVPIHQDIAAHARSGGFNKDAWATFAEANPEFMARTRKRIVSYLNEYGWRWMLAIGEGSHLTAHDALAAMDLWPDNEGRGILARAEKWRTPPGWTPRPIA